MAKTWYWPDTVSYSRKNSIAFTLLIHTLLSPPLADDWRALRRGAHEILTQQACNSHLPIQQAEATQLMFDLLTRPAVSYSGQFISLNR